MANKAIFRSIVGKMVSATKDRNEAGGPAYAFSPKHALAQYAATGCLTSTFYASAETQLDKVLDLCRKVEPEFVAKTAIFCREKGYMKDAPALLCADLSVRAPELLPLVFDRVIDNGKMLRNFVQILRSGVVGRKSLGTRPKKLVQRWLANRSDDAVFRASVGNEPSFGDIVKMVHPKATSESRQALYGWLIGREVDKTKLPQLVQQFEAWKQDRSGAIPDVPFQLLTALPLGTAEWTEIARNAGWQMTRMNLNTFVRHGVFQDGKMVKLVAERLRDADEIRKARVFPYQLLMAYTASTEAPLEIREALQDAMEIAIANVPAVDGKVYVCPDVSGSMSSPVTGFRKGATSAVRCIDVAALVAAAILRKNPRAEVIPFEQHVCRVKLNPRDSVMTNAKTLASIGGGGTNCSAPLKELNSRKAMGDLVIFVSDNESWVDAKVNRGTATMVEWNAFRRRNQQARLVCIDIQPYGTSQATEQADILNIGGFSDEVFRLISEFAQGRLGADHWVGEIERITVQ